MALETHELLVLAGSAISTFGGIGGLIARWIMGHFTALEQRTTQQLTAIETERAQSRHDFLDSLRESRIDFRAELAENRALLERIESECQKQREEDRWTIRRLLGVSDTGKHRTSTDLPPPPENKEKT